MNLAEALKPEIPARIAIVGGGGKTTALFQLAKQLPGITWATTTTHLGTDQLDFTDQHFIISEPDEIDLSKLLSKKSTLITGLFTPDDRVRGPEPEVMNALTKIAFEKGISLIVEADGSRSHPIKAPAAHEPVIPDWAEMVIVVVGLSALGKPFSDQWVHRPEQYEKLTGLHLGEPINMESICRLLIHPLGGLKGIPQNAKKVVLFNQADAAGLKSEVEKAAKGLLEGGFDRVIAAALNVRLNDVAVYEA